MSSCYLKSKEKKKKKNRKSLQRQMSKKLRLQSKYVVCDYRILIFIKEQEASRLLSSLEIKTYLNTILL